MKIHYYTVCYNEEVMLPHALKYYGQFCDRLIVYDNGSTDRSWEIVRSFPKAELRFFDTGGVHRADLISEVKDTVWKESRGSADYVIVCDMDEFIYHRNLVPFLEESKANGMTIFKSLGFVMVGESFPARDGMILDEIRRGLLHPHFDKVILFDPNAVEEMNYSAGAHECYPVGNLNWYQSQGELKLLHYHLIDLQVIAERYKRFVARDSEVNKSHAWGNHYYFPPTREWFDTVMSKTIDVFTVDRCDDSVPSIVGVD